jgi:hypothetical protein
MIKANYIPALRDDYGNTGCHLVVITAEFDETEFPNHAEPRVMTDHPKMKVLAPPGMVGQTVTRFFWIKTDLPPGQLTQAQHLQEIIGSPYACQAQKGVAMNRLPHALADEVAKL